MPAPVQRVFYLSADAGQAQHEVWPEANPRVLDNIDRADAMVFGVGSLFTSICPSLVLQVGGCAHQRTPHPCSAHPRTFVLLPSAMARPAGLNHEGEQMWLQLGVGWLGGGMGALRCRTTLEKRPGLWQCAACCQFERAMAALLQKQPPRSRPVDTSSVARCWDSVRSLDPGKGYHDDADGHLGTTLRPCNPGATTLQNL